jgi:hypothetical protein
MIRKPKEIIFLATIEYGYEDRNKGRRLSISELSNDSHDRLEHQLRHIIDSDLPAELNRIYGLSVNTRVIDIQQGSVLVFFGAVITAVGFISSYADFFESVKLIKEHSELLIERLMDKYHNKYEVKVVQQYPSLPDPDNRYPWRRLRKMFGPEADEFLYWYEGLRGSGTKRDGFFWFLLFFNIILLIIVGILVGGAVVKTYFP